MPLSSLVINGWSIFAHPLFCDRLDSLLLQVERLKHKYPDSYRQKNATKILVAINKLAFEVIPSDPTRPEYRQGNTLGDEYKHWFRAKFFQQYRLFFRYHTEHQIIIYVWVNDEKSKRAYKSKTDAYSVFRKMLDNNNPPDSWQVLLEEARREQKRIEEIVSKTED